MSDTAATVAWLVWRTFVEAQPPLRASLLGALARATKPQSVRELAQAVMALHEQPRVSRELGILLARGSVARRRSGRQVFYSLQDPRWIRLRAHGFPSG